MAKTSRLVARQAQAMESQADTLAQFLTQLDEIDQKLDLLMERLEAKAAKKKTEPEAKEETKK